MTSSSRYPIRSALAGALLLAASAAPAAAQGQAALLGAPVTSLGLGYPVPPLDARASALGGTGIGLLGGTLSFRNPADIRAFSAATIGLTLTPENVDVKTSLGTDGTGRNRFSAIRGVLPVGKLSLAAGFRAELDQDWGAAFEDTVRTTFGESEFFERQEENGGMSSFDVSGAYDLGPVTVGATAALVTGTLVQEFTRNFVADVGAFGLGLVLDRTQWNYHGWRFTGGLMTDIGQNVRLGGMFGWATKVHAENDSTIITETKDYTMPIEVGVGGSARLTQKLLLSLNGGWVQWSRMKNDLTDSGVASTFWAGGGLEFTGLSIGSAGVPVRAGYRWTELPFYAPGAQQLTESAFTAGLGLTIAQGKGRFDLGLEIGGRGDLPTTFAEESFTRWWLSFTLTGL
jgi:hypothetical protein